ncbi:MAG: AIR synthase-related protein, partial [Chloroflexota bacterium]|nr:AIR synthase-related protein [Chloroflexota bacterium]
GAAGLTCALAELTARGGVGAEVDLEAVPRREGGMSPYEVLLSESQERMLIVVRPNAVATVRAIFDRYELAAAEVGTVIDEPVIRCRTGAEPVCEVPGRALADDAPRYAISGVPAAVEASSFEALAAERPTCATLLELLASPNARDRKPIWRRYDHMNGTNTLVGPGAADAAVLRIKGTGRALALSLDGPGPARMGALDPYLAGVSAVIEGAMNVACSGAVPIGITDCLNFGSPETDLGAWQLERAIDGIADACRALAMPVVSGNVSLYNETPDGPILPTPVIGTVGLLEERSTALRMTWETGEEIWLLGDPATDGGALAGSELAWGRGIRGGIPTLDLATSARLIVLLPQLARDGIVATAHDCSVGGIGVALARMAIAAGIGLRADLPVSDALVTAAAFGERGGRVIVGVRTGAGADIRRAADDAGVRATRLGTAGGQQLDVGFGQARLVVLVRQLAERWATPF